MTSTDDLIKNNQSYAAASSSFSRANASATPMKRVAVVACMDARVNVFELLGLQEGDAHVIRNAGGVVTDDVIRSLTISQRLLGTREVVLIHHTDCGMLSVAEEELRAEIEADTGVRPPFDLGVFDDLEADVRESIARIQASLFIPNKTAVRGFVLDLKTGELNEVV
ncbi:MAG: carbonic anhydrase [Actinomycetota bacterium]